MKRGPVIVVGTATLMALAAMLTHASADIYVEYIDKDTFISMSNHDVNYGQSEGLKIRRDYFSDPLNLQNNQILLGEWTYTIPEDAVLDGVTLHLYPYEAEWTMPRDVGVYTISEHWSEDSVTWDNWSQDYYGEPSEIFSLHIIPDQEIVLDITNLAEEDGSATGLGLLLKIEPFEPHANVRASFWSSESAEEGPYVVVEYHEEPGDTVVEPASLGSIKCAYK